MLLARELTERIIGLAVEVHRLTGPGMLESVYEGCLCHELQQAEIAFQRQAGIPVTYKGAQFDSTKVLVKAVACATVEGRPTAICRLIPTALAADVPHATIQPRYCRA